MNLKSNKNQPRLTTTKVKMFKRKQEVRFLFYLLKKDLIKSNNLMNKKPKIMII